MKSIKSFYDDISIFGEKVIIASHKKIPEYLKKKFECFEYDNFGGVPALYNKVWNDLKLSKFENNDFLIFMHDDTVIKDFSFPQKFFNLLKNYECVSNSQELPLLHTFDSISHLQKYVNSNWFNDIEINKKKFEFSIIDFRCFAINYLSLRKLNGFSDLYLGKKFKRY